MRGVADPPGIFGALASPVRREILSLLLGGPQPVNRLAAHFEMTRPSVSEHLRVLLEAGLVDQTRSGRQRLYELRPEPLAQLRDWLHPYERFWRTKLRTLHQMLDEEDVEESDG
jgi:DNA-binding transcriptional ArsR family regulator